MPPRILLFLDFDSTLTTHDTLSTIADMALAKTAPSQQTTPPTTEQNPQWQSLVSAYTADSTAHATSYLPRASQRTSIAAQSRWLASLAPIEARSLRRARASSLFDGLRPDDLRTGAADAVRTGAVVLRDGWDALVAAAAEVSVAVVSVNWSRAFVRGCLVEGARMSTVERVERLRGCVRDMEIYANEICEEEERTGTGGIYTSADKANIVRDCAARVGDGDRTVVYVGDSATDFDSIVAADVGVCIREQDRMSSGQQELAGMLELVGLRLQPLDELLHTIMSESTSVESSSRSIYWTSNLSGVASLLSALLVSKREMKIGRH